MPRPPKDISGEKVGKLTPICIYGVTQRGRCRPVWLCLCDCGNYKTATAANLRQGQVKSCGCLLKLPEGEACFNRLIGRYRHDAKNRNIAFELTREQFRELAEQDCYYCGVGPQQTGCWHPNNNGRFIFNGIDRLDNNLGYTLDNCVTACGMCNRCKSTLTKKDFLEWVDAVYNNRVLSIEVKEGSSWRDTHA